MNQILDLTKEKNYGLLNLPAKILKEGNVVVYPTDTVYGIGTIVEENALRKLFAAKKRDLNKPINVLISDIKMIYEVAEDISALELKIIKNFFPGPLTIILKKKKGIPDILTAGLDTVGVRMPDNEIALKLISLVNHPLATTSANISGKPSDTNIAAAKKDLEASNVAMFIDGGESKIGIPSTIVKVQNNEIIILREGSISKEDILRKINE